MPTEFDFTMYLANLMEAMQMHEAPENVQKDVLQNLAKQAGYLITTTLGLAMGETDWAYMVENGENSSFQELISKTIENNPELAEELTEALDNFYAETVEAYNTLSR